MGGQGWVLTGNGCTPQCMSTIVVELNSSSAIALEVANQYPLAAVATSGHQVATRKTSSYPYILLYKAIPTIQEWLSPPQPLWHNDGTPSWLEMSLRIHLSMQSVQHISTAGLRVPRVLPVGPTSSFTTLLRRQNPQGIAHASAVRLIFMPWRTPKTESFSKHARQFR